MAYLSVPKTVGKTNKVNKVKDICLPTEPCFIGRSSLTGIPITQNLKERYCKRPFIFAFPGMGKTPYAQVTPGVVDADFGYFREAMKVAKADEKVLLKPMVRWMYAFKNDGYRVLTNEPKLLTRLNANECVCILPLDLKYPASKMKVSEEQIAEWVHGWWHLCHQHRVPIFFIDEGLDTFLK